MNFLGIGTFEILVIAAIAFFLLGPKKMADAGKFFGKTLRELRRQRDDFTAILMQDPEDQERERSAPTRPKGAVARLDRVEESDSPPSPEKIPPPSGPEAD